MKKYRGGTLIDEYGLTDRQRRVINLRGQGLSWRQCGNQLGVRPDTARQLYSRAIRVTRLSPLLVDSGEQREVSRDEYIERGRKAGWIR